MFKTLKRPMFRKGGSANTGIMSGMKNERTNFQDGTTEEMIKKRADLYKQYAGDPIANLLIQGGLGLVSGEGAGKGTLGAIATAFRKPTEQALSQQQQIGLKAVGDVLTEEQAMRIADAKARNKYKELALFQRARAELISEGIMSPSQEQITKRAGEMSKSAQTKTSLATLIEKNPAIRTEEAARQVLGFIEAARKDPELSTKVYSNDPVLRVNKKGRTTQADGIYFDLSVPGGRMVEVVNGVPRAYVKQ
tara:strand:+ start:344 stop:1093 length:750 start_codon:yes stop_codon:yes gene_type:complete